MNGLQWCAGFNKANECEESEGIRIDGFENIKISLICQE